MDDLTALLPDLLTLADGQYGQFGLAQLGLHRHSAVVQQWTRAGLIEPVTDQVMRVRAGGRHMYPRLHAVWLALEPSPTWLRTAGSSLVVSHTSAGHLYRALALPTHGYEFTATTPVDRSIAIDASSAVHVLELDEDEVRIVEGMLVTTPGRTVVDLGIDTALDLVELGRICQNLLAGGWTSDLELAQDLTTAFTHRRLSHDGVGWLQEALHAAAA